MGPSNGRRRSLFPCAPPACAPCTPSSRRSTISCGACPRGLSSGSRPWNRYGGPSITLQQWLPSRGDPCASSRRPKPSPTRSCSAKPSRSTRPTGRLSAVSGACFWAGAIKRPPTATRPSGGGISRKTARMQMRRTRGRRLKSSRQGSDGDDDIAGRASDYE